MEFPGDLHYTKSHEWLKVEGDEGTVGITAYAASNLGDIVFVDLPEPGSSFAKDGVFGTIESVKTVAELYMPVGGEIIEINEALADAPETPNQDPYGDGWICRIRIANPAEVDELLSQKDYVPLTEG